MPPLSRVTPEDCHAELPYTVVLPTLGCESVKGESHEEVS